MVEPYAEDPDRSRAGCAEAGTAVGLFDLRDWIKGQVTAVEVGMLSFNGAFLGQILLGNGETVLKRVERSDMVALPSPDKTSIAAS